MLLMKNGHSAPFIFYLTLMQEDSPQREYSLREVFNGLRWDGTLRIALENDAE